MSIRQARQHRGITQKEAADILGVARTTYNKYENGVHSPDSQTLVRMAQLFGCSTDYLLDMPHAPEPLLNALEREALHRLQSLSPENRNKALHYLYLLQLSEKDG
ncbi:helix-turn-helix domain-containing protein [Anaerotalea alkaliphila]|uniref:Helix-turn-helix transcriptional regulator n=1 Tax=Anaerotalea alkaliphila TaxID=2662126 RepID=A0A7X5HY47_9FIRM|nr:helix-turn-helix transcriptional regulator [Anaerotalea alkaliphila]NDL68782.1 helix-turn-helix transcriptional regulator [Anaerotalea alkaliphila]